MSDEKEKLKRMREETEKRKLLETQGARFASVRRCWQGSKFIEPTPPAPEEQGMPAFTNWARGGIMIQEIGRHMQQKKCKG